MTAHQPFECRGEGEVVIHATPDLLKKGQPAIAEEMLTHCNSVHADVHSVVICIADSAPDAVMKAKVAVLRDTIKRRMNNGIPVHIVERSEQSARS